MKKSLLIIPLAAALLAGCLPGGGKGGSSSTSKTPTNVNPSSTPEATHPASPWSAIPEGDGTESSPWNVTQAWDYVTTQLTQTFSTDSTEQDKVKSDKEYYVRGWVCVVGTLSDGRDEDHPHSVLFYMADNNHHTTAQEVEDMSDYCHDSFCVYFADREPPFTSAEESKTIEGKVVTVKGYLLNWKPVPEITLGGTIVDIKDSI